MNVVTENHADSFGYLGGQSQDGLIAAVIGESLRVNFGQEADETPEAILALLRSLDESRVDHAGRA